VEAGGAGRGHAVRGRGRVDAGTEESFVGIDVAEAANEGLVEQEALGGSASGAKTEGKIGGGDFERVGPERFVGRGEKAKVSELADVIEQERAVGEREDSARVGAGLGIDEECAGHAEGDEYGTVVE